MVTTRAELQQLSCRAHGIDEVVAFWQNLGTVSDDVHVVIDPSRSAPIAFRFDTAVLGGISAGRLRPNVSFSMHDRPSDSYLAGITTQGQASYQQNGIEYVGAADQVVLHRPNLGPRVTHLGIDSETTYLRLESWALERHLEDLIDPPVIEPIRLAPRVDLRSGPAQEWWDLLQLFNALVLDSSDAPWASRYVAPLCKAMLTTLLLMTDHQYRDALAAPAPPCAPRHVQRAVEAIHAHPEQPYTVAALAKLAGVGTRTLQQSFHTNLGTSPMAYLRQERLGRAHRDLLENDTLNIASVAYRWGFGHLGRFAAAYARQYGEPPSHTRRR